MEPKVQVIDRDDDVTTVEEYTVDEYHAEGGNLSTITSLLDVQAYIAEGTLASTVMRREDIVERAMEEDVFAAKIEIPGWFVNGDDELAETFGNVHPGATVTMKGLTEDYSEKAWRVIAVEDENAPGLSYDYEWTFLPKSVVKLFRLSGINGIEDADKMSNLVVEVRRRKEEEWSEMSWKQKLAEIDR